MQHYDELEQEEKYKAQKQGKKLMRICRKFIRENTRDWKSEWKKGCRMLLNMRIRKKC